jgi:hypothetical protein
MARVLSEMYEEQLIVPMQPPPPWPNSANKPKLAISPHPLHQSGT